MRSSETEFRRQELSLASVLGFFELDRTLAVAVSSRVLGLGANALTLLLIAKRLSPVLQGYFYTFTSLLALQSFVELGFSVVITQFASHEWAGLRLEPNGSVSGDPKALARLASLVRFACRWYAAAGGVFIVAVGVAGWVFFSQRADAEVSWLGPWLVLVPLTAIKLWIQPTLAMLEGCGQVSAIASVRLLENFVCNTCIWFALAFGFGLWISPLAAAVSSAVLFGALARKYGNFFRCILSAPRTAAIDWAGEVWPMQWRLALSGVVNYFAFSLFTPVIFNYHGAVEAGRMGMTLTLTGALTSVAAIWVQTRVPSFGVLIAKKDYAALDRAFFRAAFGSAAAMLLGALGLVIVIYLLPRYNPALARRVLDVAPSAVFACSAVLAHGVYCVFAYLRAHKKEPLVALSVISSLIIGALVWALGKRYGAFGAACAQLLVTGAVLLPCATFLGFHYRALWHQRESNA